MRDSTAAAVGDPGYPWPIEPIEIIAEDPDFVAVDKPTGLHVHRSQLSADVDTVHARLTAQLGVALFGVHRLDRAASGALLFARSGAAARALHDALQAESARKEYLVAARDATPESFEIDRPLRSPNGEPRAARTICERIASIGRHSLLRVRTIHGRRHQIRRHLKDRAHNVLGDTTHGKGRINAYLREHFGLPRLFLHAWRLSFDHPRTAGRVEIVAPLAQDLRDFLLRVPEFDRDVLQGL